MEDVKIIRADESLLKEASKALTDAFLQETGTKYTYDFTKKNAKWIYQNCILKEMEYYLEMEHEIILALKDNKVIGVVLLKLKQRKKLKLKKLRKTINLLIIPKIPMLKMINYKNMFLFIKLIKIKKTFKKPYYYLEGIGVLPNCQGEGVGKLLIKKIDDLAKNNKHSGVYLFTSDKKNQNIYEHFGYITIEEKKNKDIIVYHMFKKY